MKSEILSQDAAEDWVEKIIEEGTFPIREAYRKKYKIGKIALDNWHNPMFVFGLEYGLLIALRKFFGNIKE